uniref:NADH-ubiquinone oxidoreductase chain 6 n=1 Tax=Rhynocoris incertis TaxID=488303 RepID=A0A343W914_9HEMI|nr:NADH dehydrogenase subunit 6 [Rhynocoris incertis]AVZ00854.1 NADH dehydrogenase subunit 6 [Rhynocoris incertis]
MLYLFIMMSITISIMFIFLKHPLSMGLALILQTIMISLITGMMINNFWFSYILLITMLSGALVLFIYMASVASNEKFKSSIKMLYFMFSMMVTSLTIAWLLDKGMLYKYDLIKKITMENDQITSLTKMFNLHNMYITITVIAYLFMTMIVISYIVDVFEGPLRMKN